MDTLSKISRPAFSFFFIFYLLHLATADESRTSHLEIQLVGKSSSIARNELPILQKLRGRTENLPKANESSNQKESNTDSYPQTFNDHDVKSRLEDTPELDLLVRSRLQRLNEALSKRDLTALLRFFTPDVRLDAPGRPGVQGHGAELVFALESLLHASGQRSIIIEDMIQLQLIHLKGQNDPPKQWFLLTRNSLPLYNRSGVQEGGKAVILWEFVRGAAKDEDSQPSDLDNIKGQLMIRWLIWNDNGDDSLLRASEDPSVGARRETLQEEEAGESNSKSVRLLYSSLYERWRDFNNVLTHNDSQGCLDFTSPATVIMPPGNPAVRGRELKLVCEAFVEAGVTQHVTIHEALLFKGRRPLPRSETSSYSKVKYFVLENDAFTNTYIESETSETGKQVIFWELLNLNELNQLEDFPLEKGSLKWGWTIWNSNGPES